MVGDSRPDWAVTQEELRAMRNCTITNYMDGSVDIEYAMRQQTGTTGVEGPEMMDANVEGDRRK
jgi:hypothetical protein